MCEDSVILTHTHGNAPWLHIRGAETHQDGVTVKRGSPAPSGRLHYASCQRHLAEVAADTAMQRVF